jgi:hypothetical protein
MAPAMRSTNEPDQALIQHFIRLFGRTPGQRELPTYQRARARVVLRRPGRLRRRAARLIVRL